MHMTGIQYFAFTQHTETLLTFCSDEVVERVVKGGWVDETDIIQDPPDEIIDRNIENVRQYLSKDAWALLQQTGMYINLYYMYYNF